MIWWWGFGKFTTLQNQTVPLGVFYEVRHEFVFDFLEWGDGFDDFLGNIGFLSLVIVVANNRRTEKK
jgi:hypothetical protein